MTKKEFESEKMLYQIYCGMQSDTAFEQATNHFGAKYDMISYLFFMKNRESFIPVRSTRIDQSLRMLKIDYSTSHRCTWQNYQGLIDIVKKIRDVMNDVLILKEPATLLDARTLL